MSPVPKWFTPLAVIALLWNLMGVAAYLGDVTMSAEAIAALEPGMRALYESRTWWSTSATAVAVWGGTAGCLGLLFRKPWARPLFIASLVGLIVQDLGMLTTPGFRDLAGPPVLAIQGMVLVFAVGLMLLSHVALGRGWLATRA